MRGKMLPALAVTILVIALTPVFAEGAKAGNHNGQSNAHGSQSSSQRGNNARTTGAESSSHDPSNPDGTYRGKSPSTPDQDGIGMDRGIDNNDKTGPGTDGNNGCGNDPDREDDNNGWCGHKPETPAASVSPSPSPSVEALSSTTPTTVLGVQFRRQTQAPSVLGTGLARTGIEILGAGALAIGLLLIGMVSVSQARKREERTR